MWIRDELAAIATAKLKDGPYINPGAERHVSAAASSQIVRAGA